MLHCLMNGARVCRLLARAAAQAPRAAGVAPAGPARAAQSRAISRHLGRSRLPRRMFCWSSTCEACRGGRRLRDTGRRRGRWRPPPPQTALCRCLRAPPPPPTPRPACRWRIGRFRRGRRILAFELAPERTRTPPHSAVPHCVRRSRSPCVFAHSSTTPGPDHTHAQSRTHRQPMSPAVGSPPPTRASRLSSTHAT